MSSAYHRLNRLDWAATTTVPLDHAPPLPPEDWARLIFSRRAFPLWAKALMTLRQSLVGVIGVQRADPTTVFRVAEVDNGEAIIDTDEPHLHFVAGIHADQEAGVLHCVTAVEFHQRVGRIYFVPVRFLHDEITRSMMQRAVQLATVG